MATSPPLPHSCPPYRLLGSRLPLSPLLSVQDNRTAFFFACEHCHKPVAAFLLEQGGVDVNAKDGPSGHTVLHRACIAAQTRGQVGPPPLVA